MVTSYSVPKEVSRPASEYENKHWCFKLSKFTALLVANHVLLYMDGWEEGGPYFILAWIFRIFCMQYKSGERGK